MMVPPMSDRFTQDQMISLAANGVGKVDTWGKRGATLVTIDEVVAMAGLIAAARILPAIPDRIAPPNPNKETPNAK